MELGVGQRTVARSSVRIAGLTLAVGADSRLEEVLEWRGRTVAGQLRLDLTIASHGYPPQDFASVAKCDVRID